jgi:hypothetical protein
VRLRRPERRRVNVLRLLELVWLAVFTWLSAVLSDYLVERTTRILSLGLLAVRCDLVWGKRA